MVLLTGSQISMVISCGTIFLFTGALFLSGYVIQQRTVQGLREAIRPRMPKAKWTITTEVLEMPTSTTVMFGGTSSAVAIDMESKYQIPYKSQNQETKMDEEELILKRLQMQIAQELVTVQPTKDTITANGRADKSK